MPPAPSALIEEHREFWRRYPPEFQSGFRGTAVLSELHRRLLKQRYFPVIGSVPKVFVGRNRRGVDISVAQFENETCQQVDRSKWGLPVPNREAAYISLAKYAKDVPALSPHQVFAFNGAAEWLQRQFGIHMQNSRVKTVEEVISGLDMTTSPGFPWTRKYASKRGMYDDWKNFTQYMEDDWDRLKSNDFVAVFGNSLKEEIRLAEKIEANSLRTFTAGPVEMTIHGNRLFEDMNEKFYASHLKTASVVGFTPWRGGWDELYRKLKKFDNGFALDESQYDSSLRAYVMWAVAEFRWSMLREEDRTPDNLARLQVYYRNLVNTVIITSDGVFVQKQGGNPSGSVNTIVDNTLILYMLLAYGWIMRCPNAMRSYESFEENLALALCGDDNTWTVSTEALSFFNARSLIEEWAKIGVITTTDCLDPRPVEELDFLSAFTVFVDGVAIPLYSREKLLTSLLYSRSPGDPAYTLVRAAALLRVGWADVQLRGYLREFISWLVDSYGFVLRDSKEWKDALASVPTENDLRKFYLNLEGVQYPLTNQGACDARADECIPAIKTEVCNLAMNALPQRKKRQRNRRRGGAPPVPSRGTRQYLAAVARLPKQRGQARPRGPRGQRPRSRKRDFAGIGGTIPNMPKGIKHMKRTTFSEDEYILDVAGSTTFGTGTLTQAQVFRGNPGIPGGFPWLSSLASRFEKYVFTKLEYYYKHEVSQFATAGTIGKIILAYDYDAADAPMASKQQMMDSDPHSDAMPCEDLVLRVDCREAFSNGPKYVRGNTLPGSTDIKTYDLGNLHVACSGTSDSTTKLGEIHVRYAGYFEKPILTPNLTKAPINNTVSWFQSTGQESCTTGVLKVLALAAAGQPNNIPVVNTAGQMVPPAGNYIINYQANCISTAASAAMDAELAIQKNGVDVEVTQPFMTFTGEAVVGTACSMSASVFVAANGTDAFTLCPTISVSAGTVTATGMCLWESV